MAKRGIRKRKNRPRKRTRKNRILSEVGRDEKANKFERQIGIGEEES
jgi:hypothetical protein